jgi:excisionase family DNA binding protein
MAADTLYTVTEAAEFLGYHPDHVRRLVRAGTLRPERQIGRSYVFNRETLEAWKASRAKDRPARQTGA